MNNISFFVADCPPKKFNKKEIKLRLKYLFNIEKKQFKHLTYIFCSDNYVLRLNKKFLNHNFYTDVLSFQLESFCEDIVGEIYISVIRVKDNANTFGVTYENELFRVIIHGALHLCGYNDTTLSQKNKMRKKENFYLSVKSFT